MTVFKLQAPLRMTTMSAALAVAGEVQTTSGPPAWLPAEGTYETLGTARLIDIKPTGWPTTDIAGPFVNWCGARAIRRLSGGLPLVAHTGSGHLALPTDPLWAGQNLYDFATLSWSMSNVPAAPLSDSTGYNSFGESTDPTTAGHTTPPHTYDAIGYEPPSVAYPLGRLWLYFFPGTAFDNAVHAFDLSSPTAPPVRMVDDLVMSGGSANYGMVASDEARGGDWVLTNNGAGPLKFVRWADGDVTSFTGVEYGTYGDNSLVYVPTPGRECLIGFGRADAGNTYSRFFVCPIVADVPQGFTEVFPSGTGPTDGRCGGCWSTLLNCIVSYDEHGTEDVHKLTPPAAGSLTTGWAWTHDTLTPVGGATPSRFFNTNNGQYVENGAWSKMQEIVVAPGVGFMSHCSCLTDTMRAWRLPGM